MTRKLDVGDTVMIKFFNTPEQKFYGDEIKGTIEEINPSFDKPYDIRLDLSGYVVSLQRKEIQRRVVS